MGAFDVQEMASVIVAMSEALVNILFYSFLTTCNILQVIIPTSQLLTKVLNFLLSVYNLENKIPVYLCFCLRDLHLILRYLD